MRWFGRALAHIQSMGGARAERGVAPVVGSADVEAPRSAVLRMAARYPHLLPVDPSPDAFGAWCAHHGYDAAEPDLYSETCLAAGWPVPLAVEVALPEPAAIEIDEPTRAPALEPKEAARRFLAWVQEYRREGFYWSDELRDLYLEHADDIDHEPTPQESLRREIAKLGIRKEGVTTGMRAKTGAPKQERRVRSVRWALFPSMLSETLPWDDLPERREKVAA